MRFDEVELDAVPLGGVAMDAETQFEPADEVRHAGRIRRGFALITDLSLFAAIVVALSPLLPPAPDWLSIAALAGFVVVLSFYYFVGAWLLWGKTIGGAIFDVRVIAADGAAMALDSAVLRWGGIFASLATFGVGFLGALLPARQSLADWMSRTRCVSNV